ncbi:MAG: MFS transporter [Patescibacteria group bacterium]
MQQKYQGNIWKLTLAMMTNDVSFSIGVSVLYMLHLGLDLGQISLVVSAWLVFSTLGNIPAGIFADRYGNKLSLFCGGILFLVGTILFALAKDFYWLVAGYALMGLGSALKQGADQALLYNGLNIDGKKNLFKSTFGRMDFINNISTGVLMSLIGGFLFTINPRWPFLAEIGLVVISLAAIGLLKDVKVVKKKDSVWLDLQKSFRQAFTKPNFSRIFIFSALIGSVALTTIQYVQPVYKDIGINSWYYGLLAALMFVFRGVGAWYSDKLGKIFSVDKYLVLHAGVFGLFLIFIQKTKELFFVLPILAIFFFLRGLYSPTVSTWINEKVDSKNRATMLSINSQILTLVTSISLYFTGTIAVKYDLSVLFYVLSIFSLILLISYVLVVRKIEAK